MTCQMSARQPERGYRGFVDMVCDIKPDIALYGGVTDSRFYAGVAVSQGYQFNPWLYVGGGLLVEQWIKENTMYAAPVFAHVRTDLKFGRFTPFVDARLGYNFASYGGVYFSPAIGYRINWGKKLGVNIAVGYSLTGNRDMIVEEVHPLGPDGSWGTNTTRHRSHGFDSTIAIRVGLDF